MSKPRKTSKPSRLNKTSKPPLNVQVTTLWEYPSQHYGEGFQGDPNYIGATPSYIIWNLLQRYTKEKDLVVDPMCGSGTTLDVARDINRRALGYDVNPTRKDIFRVDARKLPLEDDKADFVFVDPPYSTHVDYSEDPRCIGKLHAGDNEYYDSMRQVISEINRILKPGKYMGLYVSDSQEPKKGFFPIGFELFRIMQEYFTAIDIISVVRHNKTLQMGNYRKAAEEGNFFLRGFNYLFIMQKPEKKIEKKNSKKEKQSKDDKPAKVKAGKPETKAETTKEYNKPQKSYRKPKGKYGQKNKNFKKS